MKKYAFVSDYARFWVLYNYGGVYFDVDVELLKPIDDILLCGPYMGLENFEKSLYRGLNASPNPGLGMAAFAGHDFLKKMLDFYNGKHFISPKGKMLNKTVVLNVADVLLENGCVLDAEKNTHHLGIYLYPNEYFNPKLLSTGKITITDNTRSIHHYAGTWVDGNRKRGFAKYCWRFRNVMLRHWLSIKRFFQKKSK